MDVPFSASPGSSPAPRLTSHQKALHRYMQDFLLHKLLYLPAGSSQTELVGPLHSSFSKRLEKEHRHLYLINHFHERRAFKAFLMSAAESLTAKRLITGFTFGTRHISKVGKARKSSNGANIATITFLR